MKKTIKAILLVIGITILTSGCESNYSARETETECNMEYIYSCGIDYLSGYYRCGYGAFYICKEVENEKDNKNY